MRLGGFGSHTVCPDNKMTMNAEPFCSDTAYDLQGLPFLDAIKPCPQLALSVSAGVVVTFAVAFIAGYLKIKMMRHMGVEEVDIRAVLSSRKQRKDLASNNDPEQKQMTKNDKTISTMKIVDDAEEQNTEQGETNMKVAKAINDMPPISANKDNIDEHGKNSYVDFDLDALVEKYSDRTLRIVDSIPRKLGHMIALSLLMILSYFTTNTVLTQLQTNCMTGAVGVAILALAHWFFPDSRITGLVFGVSRIRDGKYGRLNLITAVFGTAMGFVPNMFIIIYGIVPQIDNPSFQMLIFYLIYAPLIVGDALGELVGGPFGGKLFPTFQVRGFGEINRKSVEGCFAVFAGSMVACVIVCSFFGANSSEWIILSLALALLTTIVESAAFRSTDNFLIPVMNGLAVLLTFREFGDSFQQ